MPTLRDDHTTDHRGSLQECLLYLLLSAQPTALFKCQRTVLRQAQEPFERDVEVNTRVQILVGLSIE